MRPEPERRRCEGRSARARGCREHGDDQGAAVGRGPAREECGARVRDAATGGMAWRCQAQRHSAERHGASAAPRAQAKAPWRTVPRQGRRGENAGRRWVGAWPGWNTRERVDHSSVPRTLPPAPLSHRHRRPPEHLRSVRIADLSTCTLTRCAQRVVPRGSTSPRVGPRGDTVPRVWAKCARLCRAGEQPVWGSAGRHRAPPQSRSPRPLHPLPRHSAKPGMSAYDPPGLSAADLESLTASPAGRWRRGHASASRGALQRAHGPAASGADASARRHPPMAALHCDSLAGTRGPGGLAGPAPTQSTLGLPPQLAPRPRGGRFALSTASVDEAVRRAEAAARAVESSRGRRAAGGTPTAAAVGNRAPGPSGRGQGAGAASESRRGAAGSPPSAAQSQPRPRPPQPQQARLPSRLSSPHHEDASRRGAASAAAGEPAGGPGGVAGPSSSAWAARLEASAVTRASALTLVDAATRRTADVVAAVGAAVRRGGGGGSLSSTSSVAASRFAGTAQRPASGAHSARAAASHSLSRTLIHRVPLPLRAPHCAGLTPRPTGPITVASRPHLRRWRSGHLRSIARRARPRGAAQAWPARVCPAVGVGLPSLSGPSRSRRRCLAEPSHRVWHPPRRPRPARRPNQTSRPAAHHR